ncbi:MAG: HNH endonuclease [Minisyncoccia bacterium]
MASTYVDSKGYRRFADSGIPVHRWVAKLKLGRLVRYPEVVHHKNRNKLDNRPGNLVVCASQAVHERFHAIDGDLYARI